MTEATVPETTPPTELRKRWIVREPIPADAAEALKDFRPLTRQILFNRGITEAETARAFIEARTPANTDPFCLKDMPLAVARIRQAAGRGEQVAVYGDYDADGVTATALLVEALRAQGINAREYIPNRFDEGYGLNNAALKELQESGVSLVITVDCGIRSPREAEYAREIGLELIISDHHHPASELPVVFAIINPKQPGDTYPDKDLAGVGLAYKIAQALFTVNPVDGVDVDDWLDLVALGTVADMAPLLGENRALVAAGLKRMRLATRQGLFSLANAAGRSIAAATAADIGYRLGPRLNASGRLETALDAFNLLVSGDISVTGYLAQKLDAQNSERQQITRKIQKQAEEMVLAEDPQAVLFFACDGDFGEGVVGLAASRLVESYYRPAIVGHTGPDETRCSCRSIPEFHITDALDACADLLVRHGGHKAAAGFTVRNENLPLLKERLLKAAREQLAGLDLRPALTADWEFPLQSLTPANLPDLLDQLDRLQPTGISNPEPLFVSRNLSARGAQLVGAERAHLKFYVQANGRSFPAIAFRQGQWYRALNAGSLDKVDIMYTFEMNEYNGLANLQLNVKDIRPSGEGG